MRKTSTAGRQYAKALLVTALLLCIMRPSTPEASGMAVPLPPAKPLLIERTYVPAPGGAVPLPAVKPDFSRPSILTLLQFGQPPHPKHKPVRDTSQPVSAADASLYKKIFAWQAQGRWDKADELMNQLHDYRLRGHVLYQRYMHPTAYRASFDDLAAWMDMYADHPGADRIYKMALARRPAGSNASIRKPAGSGASLNGFMDVLLDRAPLYRSAVKRPPEKAKAVEALNRRIRADIAGNRPGDAAKHLKESAAVKYLDAVEQDQIQAQIAAGYMYGGDIRKALDIAAGAARRSGKNAPDAGWIAGLCAWRIGDYKTAAAMFELTAESPYSSPWMQAAGAYWASRAYTRTGKTGEVNEWLERAAAQPRTFYGLIATRALGWDFDFNWDMPDLTQDHVKRLEKIPAARRAIALVAAGQYHLAESEMLQINPAKDKALLEALLAYANRNALPSYAMRLAESTPGPDGGLYDAALYPLSPWSPNGGYKVDRALIYALIRQESRFNPAAESRSGAAGLMQLMPGTASFVSKSRNFRSAEGRHSLKDPQVNLDIGQRYVESLLDENHVSTELFSLMIAYNAGPGNLRKWKGSMSALADDPLLFIESIPMGETRNFVERVMSNYWIYRLRMGQPTPSLDAVAEGRWAEYVQLDGVRQASAGLPTGDNRQVN